MMVMGADTRPPPNDSAATCVVPEAMPVAVWPETRMTAVSLLANVACAAQRAGRLQDQPAQDSVHAKPAAARPAEPAAAKPAYLFTLYSIGGKGTCMWEV